MILRSISSHAECEFFCFGVFMVVFIQLKPNFFSNWLQLNNGYKMRKSPCVQLINVLINWTYFVKSTLIKHVLQTLIIGEYHEPCSIGAHLIDHRIVTQKCFFLRFNEMIAMSRVFRIERRNMGSEFDHSVNPNILVKY